MISILTLLSGNEIPFAQAQITIHVPTLKEIGYLGEEDFFSGIQLLNFSKNMLAEEDKVHLEEQTNFDIFIAILRERNAVMQYNRNCVEKVLLLLFPQYQIDFEKDAIKLTNINDESDIHTIDNSNYEEFKNIVTEIFDLKRTTGAGDEPNPSGEMSRRIAEKLKQRHQKLAELKDNADKKIDYISRQASILAAAEHIDLNRVMEMTLYQLLDQIERYQLKSSYDIYVKAKMAGAKDMKDPEDWMQDIHSKVYLDKEKQN